MEYYLKVIAAAGGGGAIFVVGYAFHRRVIRPKFPAKVNCWFCCHDAIVTYADLNSWICPSCLQYNGFKDDGDYNAEIPAQRSNPEENSRRRPRKEPTNGLCRNCNINQDLKVNQLRTFSAKDPDDVELKEFTAHLERTYRLCRYCEASLHQTLGEQDSWLKPKLLSWRLEKLRLQQANHHHHHPTTTTKKQPARNNLNLFQRIILLISALTCYMFSTEEASLSPYVCKFLAIPSFHFICSWICVVGVYGCSRRGRIVALSLKIHQCSIFIWLLTFLLIQCHLPNWTISACLAANAVVTFCFNVEDVLRRQEEDKVLAENLVSTPTTTDEEHLSGDISTLRINIEPKSDDMCLGGVFAIRKYDPFNSSGIYFGATPQPLVRPPRFLPRKTSWVAGGYWGSSKATTPRSGIWEGTSCCSSLSSSGFVSGVFGSPSCSRLNSTCDQADLTPHTSLISEPVEALATPLQPNSPNELTPEKPQSWMDRRLRIDISLYSVFLFLSVSGNIALSASFFYYLF